MTHPGVVAMVVVGFALGAFLYYMFNEGPEEHKNSYEHNYNNREYSSSSGSRDSWTNDQDEGSRKRKRRINSNSTIACCTICLEELNDKDHVELEKCHHVFHMTCLARWKKQGSVETRDKCPICRKGY